MSRLVNKEVVCPECNHPNKSRLWTSMNVTIDSDLREQVLSESLFDWRCQACGFAVHLVYPCLYHDMDRKFMIYLLPDVNDSRLEDKAVGDQFPELSGLRRRVVSSLSELKEKVLIFEARLNDMATEFTKTAMTNVVERKFGKPVVSGYFCALDKAAGTIGYSFLLEGTPKPVYYETRIQVYEKSREVIRTYLSHFPPEGGFVRIDAHWAGEVMDKLQQAEQAGTAPAPISRGDRKNS